MAKNQPKQLLIRLYPGRDDALLAAIEALPPGQREAEFRRGLAWYLVPGGFRELEQALKGTEPNSPSTSTLPTPPPNTAKAIANAMADFGWTDDDD